MMRWIKWEHHCSGLIGFINRTCHERDAENEEMNTQKLEETQEKKESILVRETVMIMNQKTQELEDYLARIGMGTVGHFGAK